MKASSFLNDYFTCWFLASVCIAAAGYIINDYFDENIDQVNKSSKVIVGKFIKRRSAIVLHAFLSFIGLALSIYIGYKLRNVFIPLFNFLAINFLLIYSSTFKKKILNRQYYYFPFNCMGHLGSYPGRIPFQDFS